MGNFTKTIGPVTLGAVNVGGAFALSAIAPLMAQLDVQIGLIGSLKADVSAQFNAAVNFQINFSNPLATLANAIKASVQVIAGLQAALALGIPPLSVQISASINIAAAALAKISLLNASIDAALGVVGAAGSAVGQLSGALSAGPVVGYGWSGVTLAQLQTEMASYNFGADGFSPLTGVYGILVLTGSPSAFAGIQFMFVTG